jgi:hypothetical protein
MRQYIESESDKHNGHLPQHNYPNTFFNAREYFMQALELYVKKYKISPEKFYGAVLLMIKWAFSGIDTEATAWWYIVPKVGKVQELHKLKIVTLLGNSEDTAWSLWERTIMAIESLQTWRIAILDEPTNGLSQNKMERVRTAVLDATKIQVFAASHNEKLIEQASSHLNWKVVELPLKK